MKHLTAFVSLIFFVACQSEYFPKEDLDTSAKTSEKLVKESPLVDSVFRDTIIDAKSMLSYDIADYYAFFFEGDINDIKNNTREDAFINRTFFLDEIDYQNGFISFVTQNTPLFWDGDSEIEDGYEITYWKQSDYSRLVALCKTKYSWVDEYSELTFYLHDEKGINQFFPDYGKWTMNDFVDIDMKALFPQEVFNNPPVYITLPKEGKEIKIDIAIHEYYEPVEVFNTFDSLTFVRNGVLLNPLEGKFRKYESW